MTRSLFLLLLLTITLSSCSTAFRREWKAATKQGPTTSVEGAWAGTWKSDVNGHHGRLRCVVGPAKDSRGTHDFHYHATWAGIFSGAYRAQHQVTAQKTGSAFTGTHDMPEWAGGRYTYGGTIEKDRFSACYQSAKDKGTFEMQRVK